MFADISGAAAACGEESDVRDVSNDCQRKAAWQRSTIRNFQEEGEGADRGKVEGGGCGVGGCTSPAVELLLW